MQNYQNHEYLFFYLLIEKFWSAFEDADHLIITRIYPAGEDPIKGVNSFHIAQGVRRCGHKNVQCLETKNEIVEYLLQNIKNGDVLMTMGAGDIGELSRDLLPRLPDSFNPRGKEK